jgi:hypothetical protein
MEHQQDKSMVNSKSKMPSNVSDESEEMKSFVKSIGTDSKLIAEHLMRQISRVTHSFGEESSALIGITMQCAIKPKDEIEALLSSQMIGVHNLAMRLLASANDSDQDIHTAKMKIENANKLLRTFTAQIETLNRHRGKGQQKVTVEHVTVNHGGQAIIGNVEAGGHEKK